MSTFVYYPCEVLEEEWGVPEHHSYQFLHEMGLEARMVSVMPLFFIAFQLVMPRSQFYCHAAK